MTNASLKLTVLPDEITVDLDGNRALIDRLISSRRCQPFYIAIL